MTNEQLLNDLVLQKQNMIEILLSVGVEVSADETLNTIIPKFTDYINNTASRLKVNSLLADIIPEYDTKTYIDNEFAKIETVLLEG